MNIDIIKPWVRISILAFSIVIIVVLSKILTGYYLPEKPEEAIIFQNALLLIVLGSAIIEHKFTKPGDSVVNSLMGIITLLTVYKSSPNIAWWSVFMYCLIVFIISTSCVVASTNENISGWRKTINTFTYAPAVFFGKARLLFSIVFLFGLLSYYNIQSVNAISLIIFWGLFIVIWPLKIPNIISSLFARAIIEKESIGKVIRIDSPNIIRAEISSEVNWQKDSPKIYKETNGKVFVIIPLYSQVKGNVINATGLCIPYETETKNNLEPTLLYEPDVKISIDEINKHFKTNKSSSLVGFVIEGSSISDIVFETWDYNICSEGKLVWCDFNGVRIYYQIANGLTKEESFEGDRHGYQIVTAIQLGILKDNQFKKYSWFPSMNIPVFIESAEFGSEVKFVKEDDFVFGKIPNTKIDVGGPFHKTYDHHTALLGVTGSGKTELALDMIRYSLSQNIKVICIDLTAKYDNKLADLNPSDLSISAELCDDLSQKLYDIETEPYGAPNAKRVLKEFSVDLREEVNTTVENFLRSEEDGNKLGIIKLQEISNTKATLYITELYLTCLLHFARDHSNDCPKVLIVVEEAHTVMPEPNMMGLGDYDSKGLVSKISQIALQGRKYGVGLLVIAQRTATVSKSVLTQCNTIISFNCFDDTSLGFLKNILGEKYTSIIPNLPPLTAVVYGKAIRSDRPIIVEIPFDENKVESA